MKLRVKLLALAFVSSVASPAAAADPSSLSHFLEQWDANGDGSVSLAEIRQGREHRFAAYDADGDGYLDREEQAKFDKVRETGIARFSEDDRVKIRRVADGLSMPRNDADGDGRVSRDEFLKGGDSWLKSLDKDGDGAVTLLDLAK
ncbi:EF hand domain-containing protein [Rhodopseudomonas faecalis]|uniref:EF hand domain-containing protein n=1 Tax=Rhodopseudomonas faecalis TaxID=99655 RepID=A0A318T747_9BRAD|nr:EF-hand domain-containing protein [Rhodopseudomonas faecalis]PYE99934.1 EF hand domain-containing protein [Rhodopseudomonas faecalis]TAH64616.1 MAG: hypothetical protein EWM45_17770 [Rhodopseudomonas palustris]